jgi:hypothetical protein
MQSQLETSGTADLLDAARRRAEELRGEAIDRIFDASAERARQALRTAGRFAASLVRHSRLRSAQRLNAQ